MSGVEEHSVWKNSLRSHKTPEVPLGQTHCEPALLSMHFAPFIHGFFGVHDWGWFPKHHATVHIDQTTETMPYFARIELHSIRLGTSIELRHRFARHWSIDHRWDRSCCMFERSVSERNELEKTPSNRMERANAWWTYRIGSSSLEIRLGTNISPQYFERHIHPCSD